MSCKILAILSIATCLSLSAAEPAVKIDRFLYGASVYPELQTRPEWNRMLDEFQKAHITVVRVSESSWGNLETAPGKYDFGWLKDFLDDVHRRGIQAILGTSSYIIPQWLYEQNPDILMQLEPGVSTHPHSRHAMCLNHPAYRAAVTRYVSALGRAFKDHPAVIGWQLDNEIEHKLNRVCYNPACQRAWKTWLTKTYGTADEFNRRLLLSSWGMEVTSLEKVPLPGHQVDGSLPALRLANLRFRRDTILGLFAEQTRALREAGVKQWITTDWNTYFTALADDPQARRRMLLPDNRHRPYQQVDPLLSLQSPGKQHQPRLPLAQPRRRLIRSNPVRHQFCGVQPHAGRIHVGRADQGQSRRQHEGFAPRHC